MGWVYYCWQRIPVKKHYIQATYLVSDNASNCNANITIIEPKTFFNADSLYWENNPKEVYSKKYTITKNGLKRYVYSRRSMKELPEALGKGLHEEFLEYCQKNSIDPSRFHHGFYFRHFDNETSYGNWKRTGVKHHIYQTSNGALVICERNDFSIMDRHRDSSLLITPRFMVHQEQSAKTLFQHGFVNIEEYYIFVDSIDYEWPNTFPYGYNMSTTKIIRFLINFFSLEDISQSYYLIKLDKDIPNLSLKLDFIGTITSEYENLDPGISIEHSRSSITLNCSSPGESSILCHIRFDDMENLQTSRLFILGVLITLTFTELIRRLYRIVKSIRIRKRKPSNVVEFEQEDESDVPDFYL